MWNTYTFYYINNMSFSLLLLLFVSNKESTRGFECYVQSCPSQEYGVHARLPILSPARDIYFPWYRQHYSVLPKKLRIRWTEKRTNNSIPHAL